MLWPTKQVHTEEFFVLNVYVLKCLILLTIVLQFNFSLTIKDMDLNSEWSGILFGL